MKVQFGDGVVYGDRVVLRRMLRADVDDMARWPPFEDRDLQWANLRLSTERERDGYYEFGRSTQTRERFTVFLADGSVIGTISLRNLDWVAREGTLGIILRADEVGRGYGRDAIRSLLAYAFEVMHLERVILDVAEGNVRAQRCYERVGFRRTGQHIGGDAIVYIDMVLERADFPCDED
jgi:RimJ/RimL family protein N-acetyltransferase